MANTDQHTIRIYNCSKQLIPIHIKQPGGDFFRHELAIQLAPGKTVMVPKSYVNHSQLTNLCKSRRLQVIYDSETSKRT